jgi:hypothetical protein
MSLAVAAAVPCGGTAQVAVADRVVRTYIAWPFDRIWTAVMNAGELFGKTNACVLERAGLNFFESFGYFLGP